MITCSVDSMSLYFTSFHIFGFTHVNVYDLGQLLEIPIDTRVHMFRAVRGFRGPMGPCRARSRPHLRTKRIKCGTCMHYTSVCAMQAALPP